MSRHFNTTIFSLLMAALFLQIPSANAFRGRLKSIRENSSTLNTPALNWSVQNPKIVFALSFLNPELSHHYLKLIQKLYTNVEVKILREATGSQIITELKDSRTVGLVLVGHTFKTRTLDDSVFLGSDFQPLPSELLSAATPALRFVAFLGCHAKGMLDHYQVSYELSRLQGQQQVYYTDDSFLTTHKAMIVDGVKHALKKINSEISKLNYDQGTSSVENQITLSISVKDVVPGIEPRYVLVNNYIVGVMGADRESSNDDQGYCTFSFSVPHRVVGDEALCKKVAIRAAELTPGAMIDDYWLSEIKFSTGESKIFNPAVHLGSKPSARFYSGCIQ